MNPIEIICSGIILGALAAASLNDIRIRRVYPESIALITVAATTTALHHSFMLNTWLPIIIMVSTMFLSGLTGVILQKTGVWSIGDTLLISATTAAAWNAPINYIVLLFVFTTVWVLSWNEDNTPFAPVFTITYLTWVLTIHII